MVYEFEYSRDRLVRVQSRTLCNICIKWPKRKRTWICCCCCWSEKCAPHMKIVCTLRFVSCAFFAFGLVFFSLFGNMDGFFSPSNKYIWSDWSYQWLCSRFCCLINRHTHTLWNSHNKWFWLFLFNFPSPPHLRLFPHFHGQCKIWLKRFSLLSSWHEF